MEYFNLVDRTSLNDLVFFVELDVLPLEVVHHILLVDLIVYVNCGHPVLDQGLEQIGVLVEVLLIFGERNLKVWDEAYLIFCQDPKDPFFT